MNFAVNRNSPNKPLSHLPKTHYSNIPIGAKPLSSINGEILPDALITYVERNIDFTDAIGGATAARAGIEYPASFDKKQTDRLVSLGLKRIETPDDISRY